MTRFTVSITYEYKGKSLNPTATVANVKEEVVFYYEGDFKGLFNTIILFDEEYNEALAKREKRE